MKPILLFFIFVLCGSVSFANRDNPLFKKYPITHEITLLSGERIPMPFQIYGGEAILIIGTANLDALTASMGKNNISPARLSSNKGLVGLYVIHYTDSVIGSYYETFVTVLANYQRPTENDIFKNYLDVVKVFIPELNRDDLEKRNLGFFAWKLWVSTDLSMRAGREIWGYNKTLADIKMNTIAYTTKIDVEDEEGPFFSASLKSILIPLMYAFPLRMDFLSTTPVEIKQTTGRAVIHANASIRALLRSESIKFNPNHKWGKTLIDVGFSPRVWIHAKNPNAVIFDPLR